MSPAAPPRPHLWLAAGVLLLALWAAWWLASVQRGRLVGGPRTWVPAWQHLGLDFQPNHYSSRLWLAGRNPYLEPTKAPRGAHYSYPPLVLWLFAWTWLVDEPAALLVWMAVLTAIAVLGARAAWRSRRACGLFPVPWPFLLAAVLWSTPVVFALERGNCDLLVVLFLLPVAWALAGRGPRRDLAGGLFLALAIWTKVYPGLLLVGLAVRRRWRMLGWAVLACLAVGLLDLPGVLQFRANMGPIVADHAPGRMPSYPPFCHTLSGWWVHLWAGTRLHGLGKLPEPLVALALALPLVLWVSRRVGRCPDAAPLLFPYLVWLAAVASSLPQVAYDYSLVYLPLAAVAVWDRRDPVAVHVGMAFLLLWWQPFRLPVGPLLLGAFKLSGLVAVGVSLAWRAAERAA